MRRPWLFMAILVGCATTLPPAAPAQQQGTTYDLGDDLTIQPLAPDIWMHVSTSTIDGQLVPAN